ncbi:MAG: primosomal protein N' [Phycisphaerae bacterium]|nr:primosomal protein N' [Phycisphaerae bacterium]
MSDLFAQLGGAPAPPAAEHGDLARVVVERGIERATARRGGRNTSESPLAANTGGLGAEAGLTYRAPDDGRSVRVGEVVEVPLGRTDEPTIGVVVEVGSPELAGGLTLPRIKRISRRTGVSLTPSVLELARWMSAYYVCPLGMVLGTTIPAAVKRRIGLKKRVVVRFAHARPEEAVLPKRMSPAARHAWERLGTIDPARLPMAPKALAAELGLASAAGLAALVRAGLLATEIREDVESRDAVWTRFRVEAGGAEAPHATPPELSEEQRRVVEGVGAALGSFSAHLLRGVTGSGKTEVYLRLIDLALQSGGHEGTAIVLVPEIALTPQTAGRFLRRFGDERVAVLHSGLTSSERHRQWAAASAGSARVVVGARSAVFAPLRNVRIIVIDEEHDSSYKQDQLPRYHARDVAVKRAQLEGCPVLMGSATPSLESWANAAESGAKYRLWEMPNRVGGGALPRVELVDLGEERRDRARLAASYGSTWRRGGVVGPKLERALRGVLREPRGQAILLLNRRGYCSYVCCGDVNCGWVMTCESCDASMVHHKAGSPTGGGHLRCHHCLAEQLLPARCPVCGKGLARLSPGIQQAEEELAEGLGLRPGDDLLRLDSDTMRGARDYFEALERFASGAARVLLGTQMIAKGLDFPGVRLVGVINADTALHLPDFRAAERTFQLLTQVAGRAGRGTEPGRVIVQTLGADTPAVRLAAAHDYIAFAERELAIRRSAGLPPARRMARIVVRRRELARARADATGLTDVLRRAASGTGVEVEGPLECPIGRIAGYHRWAVELMGAARGSIQAVLGAARARGLLKSDARTAVDVDPVALM